MTGAIKTFHELPEARRGSTPWRARGEGEARELPLVGMVRNPRSHRNKGHEPEDPAAAEVVTETTHKRKELAGVLDRFARQGIDFLAVDGGDGTVRDVLTSGAAIFGESWPPLIVLPKGKTNALAADLGLPRDWCLARAIERAKAGSFATRRTLVVADANYPEARVQGFLLGAGLFTRATSLGQSAHRLGAFNAVAVAVTALWTLAQALFAGRRNIWRRATAMRLADVHGRPLAGDAAERYLLFASTLENFPMGLKPFGEAREGLKLAMLDRARRTSLLRVPLIAAGRLPSQPERLGYHWLSPEGFRFTIEDRFILDGEAFPPGDYWVFQGPELRFVVP
jgi:hypothetical protein